MTHVPRPCLSEVNGFRGPRGPSLISIFVLALLLRDIVEIIPLFIPEENSRH